MGSGTKIGSKYFWFAKFHLYHQEFPILPAGGGWRVGVSPAAQMGCLRNRSGSPSGADQP